MIIHKNRSKSRVLGCEHRKLQIQIDGLTRENKQLRVQILKLQQRLLFAQMSKKKYKTKYKQAKQKIEIVSLIGFNNQKSNDPYQLFSIPKTKSTRIRTLTDEEFNFNHLNLFNNNLGEYDENFENKGLPTQCQDLAIRTNQSSKKQLTTRTSIRDVQKQKQKNDSQARILQNLMKLHVQLESLSKQIQQKDRIQPKIVSCENSLYRRLDEVVDKLNRMQVRELQRETKRASAEKEKQKAKKRYNSSMKVIEGIGKDLLQFKIQQ